MTDPHLPFLRAICAAPDDDLPRLIYADALDAGDGGFPAEPERAEFIRVQVELEGLRDSPSRGWADAIQAGAGDPRPHPPEGTAILALRRRERLLLTWHGVWREQYGIPYQAWMSASDLQWRRGFVTDLTLAAAAWLAHADALCAAAPLRGIDRGTAERPDWRGGGTVRLTTWPEGNALAVERQRAWKKPPTLGGHILDCWRAEWPGIAFEVPPEPRWQNYAANFADVDREELLRRIRMAERDTTFNPPLFVSPQE